MGGGDVFCVIGAGRIGLPISVSLANSGQRVVILERDEPRCKMINNSESPFYEEGMQKGIDRAIKNNILTATSDPSRIKDCNIIISAIGTGVSEDGTPDINDIESLISLISPHLSIGDSLILKTTLPIGTTRKIAEDLSAASGLELDEDLFVAFSPERIVEGRAMEELKRLPKIIGGVGPNSTKRVSEIMKIFGGGNIVVSNSRTAEMCKLLDNAYRMTRFGFSADVASVAWRNGIDAFEAIEAANLDYERNNIPLPSVGVSGYCLTKDPYYLDAGAKELWSSRGFPSTWINARHAADWQMNEAIERIVDELPPGGANSKIVVAGVTYKEDVDDIRMSHGVEIGRELSEMGYDVNWWDPVTSLDEILDVEVSSGPECLAGSDLLIITVPHLEFLKWSETAKELELMRRKIIFDGWGVFSNFERDGVRYIGTGRN